MAVVVLLVVLCGLGALSIWGWRTRARRYRRMAAVAAANGFAFGPTDQWQCTRVPFRMFREGDGRFAENVMLGRTDDGLPVRAFDFTYYDEYDDGRRWDRSGTRVEGRPTRRYHHYSCALTEMGVVWPHLVIEPETLWTRVFGSGGLPDIDFESEAFNRTFTVTCEDRRFAQLMCDPGMMDFLLSTEGRARFEVRGRWLLITMERVPPALALSLVGLSTAFREQVPGIVGREYTVLTTGERVR